MSSKKAERLERIRIMTARDGAIRLEDVARALDVSSMTIRRDLADAGSEIGLLGGHVIARSGLSPSYTLATEQGSHLAAKAEAGRRAAALVAPGDTIFVDCGTTMPHLMAALPHDLDATIVCFSLNIALAASRMPRVQFYLLGGLFQPSAGTFQSDEAMDGLQRLSIGKAFLSAGGLHATQGATCSNFHEVPVKRAVLKRASQAFLVIDSSKRGVVKPAQFAPRSAFDRVVTEKR